ncbi:hypothetical protein LUZ62_036761 [Rhynchospora pubera]|uniref:Uncharacterized protein n=1 Tax=Rhynchospora pubera TaxID=906938 RepID=A0AAV8EZE1_9POAL|nr:hypothetical protein LUZ62_036761 [Rhynchospora pubera]
MATTPAPSPPTPSSTLDLNLNLNLLTPQRTLKPEPLHIPISPSSQTPIPLQILPSDPNANPDEETLFAEYFRLASLYLSNPSNSSSASTSQALIPFPLPPSPSSLALQTPQAPVKKRKPRSSDMVRVTSLTLPDQIYFRDNVRRARITFESLRIQITHNQLKAEALGLIEHQRNSRPDLKAAALMADRELWLNRDKRIIGSIPGIAVGDCFYCRMELCVLGLHGQVQAGIDYVRATQSSSGEPIATSIIVSGGYEDDDDKGDVLIYTGHGGRDPNLHKHCVDQKLEGGNLALERSMTYGIEIRVVRGIRARNVGGKVYFYDGLYKVVDCWLDRGKSGFGVYKYKMLRIEGQEEMGTVNYRMAEDLKVNPLLARPVGYLSVDLSVGREKVPILLYNDIDDDQDPLLFQYLARPIFPASVVQGKFASGGDGCGCIGNCTIGCSCAEKNGGEFAYDVNGTLLRGKPLVYECGPYCNCPATCSNRVSQKGLMHRLEVFRSTETGWGVRSLDLIRAGTFVCEFSGIVLTKQQSEANSGECLVYPNQLPARWLDWGDISDVMPDYTAADFPPHPDINFSIDVSKARNVACYLSHSCSPNVFVQYVLFDHYNPEYPHLMVYAMENIPPMRELSIDYGIIEDFVGKLTNE